MKRGSNSDSVKWNRQLETVWQLSTKLSIVLTYTTVVMYVTDFKMNVYMKSSHAKFYSSLMNNHQELEATDICLCKCWGIHTMEDYSVVQRNKLSCYAKSWMCFNVY